MKQITIKPDTLLHSATDGSREIAVINDGWDDRPVWLVEQASGNFGCVVAVVAERSFEAAYSAWVDEAPTVPPEDLHDAYGFNTPQAYQDAVAVAEELETYVPLADGYTYQGNASGTGIVYTADTTLGPLTRDRLRDSDLNLQIRGPGAGCE